jgi:hypothetical protein
MKSAIAAVIAVTVISLESSSAISYQDNSPSSHTAWVAKSLRKMEAIKPRMTRADLLRVFTVEGGLSSRTTRTYVSLDCPLFKVDVRSYDRARDHFRLIPKARLATDRVD